MTYSVNEVQELYEDALESIYEILDQKPELGEKPKPVKTIKPASLKQKPYLETEADVNEFVGKVKDELLEAVRNNIRVRIE